MATVGPERVGGRGLYLAQAVADVFGVTDHAVGKTVWCAFDVGLPEAGAVAE